MKFKAAIFMAAAVLSSGLCWAQREPTLKEGDPAPVLDVARWVKGNPIGHFEKGRIYVVEFWATWCGPCKMAIPHLTELQKRYRDQVTVIGVDIDERGEDQATNDKVVDQYVKSMGEKMDYHVARDYEDGRVAHAWTYAAGTGGIPATFVINKEGVIVMIDVGFKPERLERVVRTLAAGTYDAKQETETLEKERDEEARKSDRSLKVQQEFAEIAETGDWKKAYAYVTQARLTNSDLPANWFAIDTFAALTHIDWEKARQMTKEEGVDGMSVGAYMACNIIAAQEGLDRKAYKWCIKQIHEQVEQGLTNYAAYEDLAKCYARLGDYASAVKTQQALVDRVQKESPGLSEFKMAPLVDPLKEYRKQLEKQESK